MPWKECSVTDERVRFVGRLAGRARKWSELCREFGISAQNRIQNLRPLQGMRDLEALTDRSSRASLALRATKLPPQVEAATF